MTIAHSMLPEFDQEIASTRKLLERVPGDKLQWKPHEKSWTLGALASHIVNLLVWTAMTIEQDAFDMDPDSPPPTPPEAKNSEELVSRLDENAAAARKALEGTDDATMMREWSLKSGDQIFFTMPKVAVIRSFVMNHLIHHRGQLTVYLRQCDVPLPGIYGPTADEQ